MRERTETAAAHDVLTVDRLEIDAVKRHHDPVRILRDVSFRVASGEILGLVGETGSGKSVTAKAIVGVLPPGLRRTSGSIRFQGADLATASRGSLRTVRGAGIAFVPQDLRGALHPTLTLLRQFELLLRRHGSLSKAAARAEAEKHLELCGISDVTRVLRSYPQEMSGGMAQRATIALTMALKPDLLVADEPTTASDVTVQKQILDVLFERVRAEGVSVLLITHDLGIVDRYCDRVAVMNTGVVVESGPTSGVLTNPQDAYTQKLVRAVTVTKVPAPAEEEPSEDAVTTAGAPPRPSFHLQIEAATKTYHKGAERIQALDAASLRVEPRESVGIVGESGSGKSTLLRLALGLEAPDGGSVSLFGNDLATLTPAERRKVRERIGTVFQEPREQLDPRWTVGRILREPARIHGAPLASDDELVEHLARVSLRPEILSRRPDTLSGGQAQRVAIARALMLSPQLLFLDEPTASLDKSTRSEVLGLFARLKEELGLTLVFVSHDLDSVREVTDRVLVMRQGAVVEQGPVGQVLHQPQHPYTRLLLASEMRLEHTEMVGM
jgi:peptide/nickel transport system ATP-binding protein